MTPHDFSDLISAQPKTIPVVMRFSNAASFDALLPIMARLDLERHTLTPRWNERKIGYLPAGARGKTHPPITVLTHQLARLPAGHSTARCAQLSISRPLARLRGSGVGAVVAIAMIDRLPERRRASHLPQSPAGSRCLAGTNPMPQRRQGTNMLGVPGATRPNRIGAD